MLPVPRLISFDVYGTLVDVRSGSRDVFASILGEAGGGHVNPLEFWESWEAANVRRYAGPYRPYRAICRDSLAETFVRFGMRGDPDLIDRYFAAFPKFQRFPDVDEVLDGLAATFDLAVVSNIDDELLAATDLGREFDVVCTAERARGYKPDGRLFRHLLDRAHLLAPDVLHCGQSQGTDLVGAKPLGIRVAWINRRTLVRAPDVPPPDFEFGDLRPLLDLL